MEFRKKTATLLIAIFMMSAFAAAVPVFALPYDVWVDDDYTSSTPGWETTHWDEIQEGIDVVADYGTVHVAAGMYNEHLAINKPLTLKGAQFGVDPASGTRLDPVAESIIDLGGSYDSIEITASDVTVDGFTMQNAGYFLIQTDTSNTQNNVVLRNNILSGGRVQLYGIDGLVFSHNQISGFAVWGSSGTVSNNKMDEVLAGISVMGCDGLTITDNTITARVGENTDFGIYIDGSANTEVKSNTISGFKAGERSGYTHGTRGAGIFVYSTSGPVLIEENDIKENSVGVYVATISAWDSPQNVEIYDNNIEDNGDYGVCNFRFPPQLKDPASNENLYYWEYIRFVEANVVVDATLNWWGTTDPVLIAAMVSDFVDYVPWLGQSTVGLQGTSDGYDLTVDILGDGDVTPLGKVDCVSGEVVDLTADPDENWHFKEWSGQSSGTSLTTSVTMISSKTVTATFELDIVSISVSPTSVDFGTVIMGEKSAENPVIIKNEGNVLVEIDAEVIEDDTFFADYLRINTNTVSAWSANEKQLIPVGKQIERDLVLDLTAYTVVGSHEGVLVFWAEQPA